MTDHSGFKIFLGFLGLANTYFAALRVQQNNMKLGYMNEKYKYQTQKLELMKQNTKQLN